MTTTIQLRPGFWRDVQSSVHEVFGERDGIVHGRRVSDNAGVMWNSVNVAERDLVEYLGPTMPPDPGEGYRLLKIGESRCPSDEFEYAPKVWKPVSTCPRKTYFEQIGHGHLPHRRRMPPTPPEGWELLPDGTKGHREFRRFLQLRDGGNTGWVKCTPAWDQYTSGAQPEGDYLWYARRKPAEWTETRRVRAQVEVTLTEGIPDFVLKQSHREYRNADGETQWRPV